MFYENQDENQKNKYKEYLKLTGALSNLFSESSTPYLYYRAAENLFCLAFNADNLSRSDVSADAKKNNTGIGLKTFIHGNGNTMQKVAEFNAISNQLQNKTAEEKINIISISRNLRISSTIAQFGLDNMIYHCVTRSEKNNSLFECNMDLIHINNITKVKENNSSILFSDDKNEYSFNKSKSTLFKRFLFERPIDHFDIHILKNPFEDLSCLFNNPNLEKLDNIKKQIVYLPLYAPSSATMEPAPKSGLNQWNAAGRARDENEVYIPIPAWIYHKFPDFFPDNNDLIFNLKLPNDKILNAKLCQTGRKGLMSNPNKDLGKWLLRDVLKVPEDTLITREILDIANIDSAIIEKVDDRNYKIDFASVGKYEQFKNEYNY